MSKRPNRMANPIVPPREARTEQFAEAEDLSAVIQAKLEGVFVNG